MTQFWATTFVPSKSKRKRTSCRPFSRIAWRSCFLSLGVEHQEAAAAGADELAAERAVGHGVVVPVVDLRLLMPGAARLLALPVDVHQPGELLEVAGLERGPGFGSRGPW